MKGRKTGGRPANLGEAHNFTLRISREQSRILMIMSLERKVTVASLIREAIDDLLDNWRDDGGPADENPRSR